ESGYQDLVSRHLGTEHERVVVDSTQIGEVFPEVVWHGEHPILRTAPAPLFLLSGLVRSAGYKVVVTGEGSDEVLAGYDIFRETIVRRYAAEHPDSADLDELVVRLYPWMERSPTQVPAFAKAFFGQAADVNDPAISHRPRWRASGSLLRMLDPEFGAPPEGAAADELLSELPERFWSWDPVERAQYLEMSTLLPGYILAPQGDRMLMGHSVEGRFPFLDHNVIEFASSLPVDQKLRNLDEKHILKHAFRDIVPVEVIDRPKQPYRAPDAASFFSGDALPAWLDDLLDRDYVAAAGVFRPEVVEGVVRKARSRDGLGMSNTDNMRIVALISTMLLHTSFVSGRGAFERARREADTVPFERIEPRGVYAGT
ncbi:MAG: asparagine synthetase B family protein, partial [bacterium]